MPIRQPTGPGQSPQPAGRWSAGGSLVVTLLVAMLGVAVIGVNAGIAYATVVWSSVIPIMTGLVFCLAFAVAVRLLHRATWLAVLSILPAVFVLVGSVQLAPEAVLERRGTRQEVAIVDVEVNGNRHAFHLQGSDGPLDEQLIYQGSFPSYRVGDRLTVVVDPDGVVELEDADDVDSAGKLGMLVMGGVGWSLIASLAGWRGHVRRKKGR
ncbi:hypothetical protein [Micromonospora polyrhachis]|uniref:Uncharacterized protein n=1 Tax=Micromonospora polyrhachis TaxID=1282883 RepID=A0A7W7SWL5_9ACTN|nr:hypothetical protein [Micromonospora polyrhachis]MBB4962264.1 hypothetical protein [Micromonospora polyrhachis]